MALSSFRRFFSLAFHAGLLIESAAASLTDYSCLFNLLAEPAHHTFKAFTAMKLYMSQLASPLPFYILFTLK
jgi:hypothetical protein